jgi:hypothetical protein
MDAGVVSVVCAHYECGTHNDTYQRSSLAAQ